MFAIGSERKTIGVLSAALFAFGVFDVVVWHSVLGEGLPASFMRPVAHVSGVEVVPAAPPASVPETVGLPVRLKIPSIALDAPVVEVALASDGSMAVPKRPLDSGWYALGPRPGELGSAAIAGHVDWANGATAVFADLHKVRKGDKIDVQDDEGSIVSFVVRERRRYDAEADAIEVFGLNDGKAHLNIVTCDGEWDKRAAQYSERLVVFADKVFE